MSAQPNNPLHGIKLQDIVEHLVIELGWEEMSEVVNIKCFKNEPSVKSSLKFLRRMPWARKEVETLYLNVVEGRYRKRKKPKPKRRNFQPRPPRKETNNDDGLDW